MRTAFGDAPLSLYISPEPGAWPLTASRRPRRQAAGQVAPTSASPAIPGHGVNGVIEALRKRQDEVRFIQVRHEEASAYEATAYAKFTGSLGSLPLDLRARRHPPAERSLRRAVNPTTTVIGFTLGLQFRRPGGRSSSPRRTWPRMKLFAGGPWPSTNGSCDLAHVRADRARLEQRPLARRQPAHLTICVDHQSEALEDRTRRPSVPHRSRTSWRAGSPRLAGQPRKPTPTC